MRVIFVGIVVLGGFLVALGVSSAQAQSTVLSDKQLSRIRANCQTTKSTLHQLHGTDALLRVNRGQVYESLSTKLMERFNARLSNNRLDNKATVAVSSNYNSALNIFRSNYKAYEERLSDTLKMDCGADPAGFYWAIDDARSKRARVHEDVLRLHRYVDDYRSAVDDFLLNYDRTQR